MIYAFFLGVFIGIVFATVFDWAVNTWNQGKEYRRR